MLEKKRYKILFIKKKIDLLIEGNSRGTVVTRTTLEADVERTAIVPSVKTVAKRMRVQVVENYKA